MPILDIPTKDLPSYRTDIEIYSVITFPSNEDLRNQYKATFSAVELQDLPERRETLKNYLMSNTPFCLGLREIIEGNTPGTEGMEKFVNIFIDASKRQLETVFLNSKGISTLVDSPEWKKIEAQSLENNYKGILAGHILTYIWQMGISRNRLKSSWDLLK